ncbi:MAG: hypothetical protein K9I94_02475 [Bacteroidales bacterium]|nr:hypothetical protein [Bacteroidales bacterium]
MKRQIAGIVLIFCFAAPIIATYTWLQYKKSITKKEVKQQLVAGVDKNELILLKFSKNDSQKLLNWKHSKEFEYDDRMYDIVKTELQGDTAYYWCWLDYKETRLNKELKKLVAHALGNNNQRKETKQQLTNFYKSLYWGPKPIWFSSHNPATGMVRFAYFESYTSRSFPPPTPPPKG